MQTFSDKYYFWVKSKKTIPAADETRSIIEKDLSKEEFESILRKLFTSQELYIPLKYPSYILSGTTMYLNNYENKENKTDNTPEKLKKCTLNTPEILSGA